MSADQIEQAIGDIITSSTNNFNKDKTIINLKTTVSNLDKLSKVLVEKYKEIENLKDTLASEPDSIPVTETPDLVNVTAYFNNATHYQDNVKSNAAFVYSYNSRKYLVTTAHTIFINWQTTSDNGISGAKIADLVTASCIKKKLRLKLDMSTVVYSRIYDLAFFDITTQTTLPNSFSESTLTTCSNAKISYRDSLTSQETTISAKYVEKVASNYHLGAFALGLTSGSSGTPVTDELTGKLVGMISSKSNDYENMAITVPITVINKILELSNSSINGNFDDSANQFADFSTVLITQDHLNSVNQLFTELIDSEKIKGELVTGVFSDEIAKVINILPFDIITEIGGEKVGLSYQRMSKVLLDKNVQNLDVKYLKLKDDYRQRYFRYPREVAFKLTGTNLQNSVNIELLNNIILKNYTYNTVDKSVTFTDIDASKLSKIAVKGQNIKYYSNSSNKRFRIYQISDIVDNKMILNLNSYNAPDTNGEFHLYPRGGMYTIQPNRFLSDSMYKSFYFKSGNFQNGKGYKLGGTDATFAININVASDINTITITNGGTGYSTTDTIKLIGNGGGVTLSITSVDSNGAITKINVNKDEQNNLGWETDTTYVQIQSKTIQDINDSSIMAINGTPINLFDQIKIGNLDDIGYKSCILLSLVRSWSTIVCRGISNFPQARQLVVLAVEMYRLLDKLYTGSTSTSLTLYYNRLPFVMFHQFLEKVVEFTNINAGNLVAIFWQKVFSHQWKKRGTLTGSSAERNVYLEEFKSQVGKIIIENINFYPELQESLCSLESGITKFLDVTWNYNNLENQNRVILKQDGVQVVTDLSLHQSTTIVIIPCW